MTLVNVYYLIGDHGNLDSDYSSIFIHFQICYKLIQRVKASSSSNTIFLHIANKPGGEDDEIRSVFGISFCYHMCAQHSL